jgi:competence protein ComEC
VLTHPQRDHVGGAADVLRSLDVNAVLDPEIEAPSTEQTEALAAARARQIRILPARAGTTLRLGKLRLRVLWPPRTGMRPDDPNDAATVLLASYGSVDALLTADAESNVTLPLAPPEAEILKVAHHGSADEGLGELLARVDPRVALISVGARNDYGHPTPATLRVLEQAPGLTVYRTDENGRVSVDTDGSRILVRAERE